MTSAGVVDLSVNIGALHLRNPIIAASGTFGYGLEFAHLVDLNKLGGFVTKGLSLDPIEGSPAPRLCETPSGMLNAVGLQNVGVRAFIAEKMPVLRNYDTSVIVNVFGYSPDEYSEVIRILEDAPGLAAYELNISCPNVKQGGIQFGSDPAMVSQVVGLARRPQPSGPYGSSCRLSLPDIGLIARAAEEAGADGLTVANTYPPWRSTQDWEVPSWVPDRRAFRAGHSAHNPAVGLGSGQSRSNPDHRPRGDREGDDVLEYLAVGATAVQVGTASFVSPTAPERLAAGLQEWLLL